MNNVRRWLQRVAIIVLLALPVCAQTKLGTVVFEDSFSGAPDSGEIAKGWRCWYQGALPCPQRGISEGDGTKLIVRGAAPSYSSGAYTILEVPEVMRKQGGNFLVTVEASAPTMIKEVHSAEPNLTHLGVTIYGETTKEDGSTKPGLYFSYYPTEYEKWNEIGFNIPAYGVSKIMLVVGVFVGDGQAVFRNVSVKYFEPRSTGAITLQFDDGYKSTYTEAYPLMRQHDLPGSLALVSSLLGQQEFLTSQDVLAMLGSGWDVLSHSDTHPDLVVLAAEKGTDAVYAEVLAGKLKLERWFGIGVPHFAAPFGAQNGVTQSVIDLLFRSQRTFTSGENYSGVFSKMVNVFQVYKTTTRDEFYAAIEKARLGAWIIFVFHDIGQVPTDYGIYPSQFVDLINAVKSAGVPVVNYRDGFNLFSDEPPSPSRSIVGREPIIRPMNGRGVDWRTIRSEGRSMGDRPSGQVIQN